LSQQYLVPRNGPVMATDDEISDDPRVNTFLNAGARDSVGVY